MLDEIIYKNLNVTLHVAPILPKIFLTFPNPLQPIILV
jgi:hypothetical protein